ncbi:homoserine kinase [Fangia hongkongensis]|uniref:homoserine kinase n=1 Tax=Fangia hongkongensis TaxID=270495 RepID=UPI000360474C|nr:homoserine kinase [Fangia hongkongensis]
MIKVNDKLQVVTAYAPGSSANFAVGFDLIGFAVAGVGDRVTLERREDDQLHIKEITGVVPEGVLPLDVKKNVATAVIRKFLADYNLPIGFDVSIDKGIPMGSGIGGSAASSVAAILAVNAFLDAPLSKDQLIDYAIYGESLISGGVYHGDNAVPSMFGGLVLLQSSKPCQFVKLPTLGLYALIACPEIEIKTKEARKLLEAPYVIGDVVKQCANLAGVISALYTNNLSLLQDTLEDQLIEPRRKSLIPGFDALKEAAKNKGAIGVGISGSGPAVFAIASTKGALGEIAKAMDNVFLERQINVNYYISSLNCDGGYIESKVEK